VTTRAILEVGKGPIDILPVWLSWAQWLSGEAAQAGTTQPTITSSAWSVEGGDGDLEVLSDPAPSVSGGTTGAWISGGTSGQRYRVVNTIETSAGHTVARAIAVVVS